MTHLVNNIKIKRKRSFSGGVIDDTRRDDESR